MDAKDAARTLSDVALTPVMMGSMAYIKELWHKCLDADIPALTGCPPGMRSS